MAIEQAIMVDIPLWIWVLYHAIIIPAIIIDLLVGQKLSHDMTVKEAIGWVILWVSIASFFGVLIFFNFGFRAAAEYFTAYIVEYTLSFDNLFVFLVIFDYFSVPFKSQHKTLYIGILSAIVFRALFIVGGIALVERFEWAILIFAIILIISGIKLLQRGEERVEPEKNPFVRLAKRYFPVTDKYHGSRFLIKENDKIILTPLVIVLIAIETTDIMFAVDSVPAVIAITQNFFLAYTSNISAILGLRSLYFALTIFMKRLRYLNVGLSIVLIYLGIKIILGEITYKLPLSLSLGIVLGIIFVATVASLLKRE
jgi:tellurite resistance protein TerC